MVFVRNGHPPSRAWLPVQSVCGPKCQKKYHATRIWKQPQQTLHRTAKDQANFNVPLSCKGIAFQKSQMDLVDLSNFNMRSTNNSSLGKSHLWRKFSANQIVDQPIIYDQVYCEFFYVLPSNDSTRPRSLLCGILLKLKIILLNNLTNR